MNPFELGPKEDSFWKREGRKDGFGQGVRRGWIAREALRCHSLGELTTDSQAGLSSYGFLFIVLAFYGKKLDYCLLLWDPPVAEATLLWPCSVHTDTKEKRESEHQGETDKWTPELSV